MVLRKGWVEKELSDTEIGDMKTVIGFFDGISAHIGWPEFDGNGKYLGPLGRPAAGLAE